MYASYLRSAIRNVLSKEDRFFSADEVFNLVGGSRETTLNAVEFGLRDLADAADIREPFAGEFCNTSYAAELRDMDGYLFQGLLRERICGLLCARFRMRGTTPGRLRQILGVSEVDLRYALQTLLAEDLIFVANPESPKATPRYVATEKSKSQQETLQRILS